MSSSSVEYSIAPSLSRDPFRDRQPPYSEDAEQAVLSAMLMDADAVLQAIEILDASHFYAERHRRIFRAMVAIAQKGGILDPLTLSDELGRSGELEASGGKDYIAVLVDAAPTAANITYHAAIVREKWLRRSLIEAATSIVHDVFSGRGTAEEQLDQAEHKIFLLSADRDKRSFVRIKELLWSTMERIEGINSGRISLTGVPSGFADLDEMTYGFQPSDFIVIAARPSMGKTAFSLNIAQNAAIDGRTTVAFFSLEMSRESLATRLLTAEARVDAHKLRKGMLQDHDFGNLAAAAGTLTAAPIWIDDSPSLTVLELRSKARRLKAEGGLGLIVVDYLQLMEGPVESENRQQEISQVSRGLKSLAKELNVPVIALSQLSRALEQRENKRPQLSDLRESGAIEQDADLVLFLYRPEVYATGGVDKDGNSVEGLAEVLVSKQRNGPTGIVNLRFTKQYTRFENYSARDPGPAYNRFKPDKRLE